MPPTLYARFAILPLALMFGAGLCALHSLPSLPSIPWLLAGGAGAGLLAYSLPWRTWLLACIVGFLWGGVQASARLDWVWPEEWSGIPLPITVKIIDVPLAQSGSWSLVTQVVEACHTGTCLAPGAHVQLTARSLSVAPKAGEVWQFIARVHPPHGRMNPGGFDNERQWFASGIRAFGVTKSGHLIQKGWALNQWRSALYQQLSAHHPHPLIPALVLGIRQDIRTDQWQVFRDTGTAHLMAISGLHIGGVAAMVYPLVAFLWRRSGAMRIPAPIVGACAALVLAFAYSLLAGWSIPTQRACWMVFAVMGARMMRGHMPFWDRWGFALLIILVADPFAPLSSGFWLSFGAVGWLVLGSVTMANWPRWTRLGVTSLVAAVGMLPMTAYFFEQSTLISPIANLIAIPWMSFLIVPIALLGTILLPFPWLSELCLAFAGVQLQGLEVVLGFFARHPIAVGYFSAPSLWSVVIATVGALLLCRGRWWAISCFVPLFLAQAPAVPPQGCRLTMLDVGQGLAVVVETAHHVLVYDTGPRYGYHSDAGVRILVPFLHHQGQHRVDRLVLSHLDMDHIGGTPSLLASMPVDSIMSPQPYPNATLCRQGQRWEWDGVVFEFLHPAYVPATMKKNNSSCVLAIQVGAERILLPGDIEASVEQRLVAQYGTQLASSFLFIPHHGSRSSSSHAFLQAVHPVYSLLSMGYHNRYGHPHAEVLARYTDASIAVHSTVAQGAVQVDFQAGHAPKIRAWREITPHYWRSKG